MTNPVDDVNETAEHQEGSLKDQGDAVLNPTKSEAGEADKEASVGEQAKPSS